MSSSESISHELRTRRWEEELTELDICDARQKYQSFAAAPTECTVSASQSLSPRNMRYFRTRTACCKPSLGYGPWVRSMFVYSGTEIIGCCIVESSAII